MYQGSNSKEDMDKERLKLHLIGVLCFGGPIPLVTYLSKSDIANDPNLTIHIIMDFLRRTWTEVKNGNGKWCWPEVLYIQLDNATNSNKNNMVFGFLSMLVWRGVFRKIKVGFEVVGHTHDLIDQVFSRISRYLGTHDAWSFEELEQNIMKSYTVMGEETGGIQIDPNAAEDRVVEDGLRPIDQKDYDESVVATVNIQDSIHEFKQKAARRKKKKSIPVVNVVTDRPIVAQIHQCVLAHHLVIPYCEKISMYPFIINTVTLLRLVIHSLYCHLH